MDKEKQTDRVQKIPITELVPFKDHPFKVVEDESMLRTTESISMFGVLTPLIARPAEDGKFEIISGHRRAHAAEAVGLRSDQLRCRVCPVRRVASGVAKNIAIAATDSATLGGLVRTRVSWPPTSARWATGRGSCE